MASSYQEALIVTKSRRRLENIQALISSVHLSESITTVDDLDDAFVVVEKMIQPALVLIDRGIPTEKVIGWVKLVRAKGLTPWIVFLAEYPFQMGEEEIAFLTKVVFGDWTTSDLLPFSFNINQ